MCAERKRPLSAKDAGEFRTARHRDISQQGRGRATWDPKPYSATPSCAEPRCAQNATTWMLPGELFPTEVRATCHGISAAAGKVRPRPETLAGQVYSASGAEGK